MSSSLTLLWSDRPPALTFWGPVTGHVAGPQKHLSPTHSMTLRVLQPCSGHVPAGNMEQDPGFHPCPTVHTAGPGWVEPRAGPHPNLEIAGEMGRGRRGSEWAAGGPLVGASSAEGPESEAHLSGPRWSPQIFWTILSMGDGEKDQARTRPDPDVSACGAWVGRPPFAKAHPLLPPTHRSSLPGGHIAARLVRGQRPQLVGSHIHVSSAKSLLKGPRLEINSLKLKSITMTNINTDCAFFIVLCSWGYCF